MRVGGINGCVKTLGDDGDDEVGQRKLVSLASEVAT